MSEYLACGNIMSDAVDFGDGSFSEFHLGGPAFFALTGARLFTKSCALVTRTGADYTDGYGAWLRLHGLPEDDVKVVNDRVTYSYLKYNPDGSYQSRSPLGLDLLGFQRSTPEDIAEAAKPDTKAAYLAFAADLTVWRKLARFKEEKGFQMMWEIMPSGLSPEVYPKVREISEMVEMFSLNSKEASQLLLIPREDDEGIINELMKLKFQMIFYRVGKRGAYVVTPTDAVFCPAIDAPATVDPTGCGNCSTGAAMYAWAEGCSPKKTAVMANVAAGLSAAQYGPIPLIDGALMNKAAELTEEYLKKL